ncbi:tRNA guanosine(34) transglycosylase Tgt [Leptospira sp. GIMC2001]|uniref:tRNA guanosine(34) transglycosylase Tgt n=1 Tax=Leptospira sp. GIMC2001 TaxID=1513297 RepID=UPI00234916B5|nr:tRNA guanosine(34) transglycosylase Tgt [Leptospira sp. GIMC2001]WCL48645.1 tRNA guanosine(34) transglycosylase Tgt [Leptospira sp. GIMC2001]
MIFKELKRAQGSFARTGLLNVGGRSIETPIFMPVGTQGTIKALSTEDINELGYELILSNTYHLYLRPGTEVLDHFHGVKKFMGYDKAMLTDSGGYQMFSLSSLFKFEYDGVKFQSHLDGSRHKFTPEKVLEIQRSIGSDIWMVLDDCAPYDSNSKRIQESLDRTHRWAENSIKHWETMDTQSYVFGISQGAMDLNARKLSLEKIQSYPFAGIAVGGLSVGEPRPLFIQVLEHLAEHLDPNRAHYLMGVGTVPDILDGVRNGIDMFDCVLPTRNARNAQVFTRKGKLNLRNEKFKLSDKPIDEECNCKVCKNYSLGYLRHLHKSKEILALQLSTFHNLQFMRDFMQMVRNSIESGYFPEFYTEWKNLYDSSN